MNLIKVLYSNFVAPCNEVVCSHHFDIFFAFKVLKDMDHVVTAKCLPDGHLLFLQTLCNSIEDCFCNVQHLFFINVQHLHAFLLLIIILILGLIVLLIVHLHLLLVMSFLFASTPFVFFTPFRLGLHEFIFFSDDFEWLLNFLSRLLSYPFLMSLIFRIFGTTFLIC